MTDFEAVTQFEAWVQRQQPAPMWTAVTPYDMESRRFAEGLHPARIKSTFQPKNVLDVGCGPDAILVRLLREIGVTVTGIDPQLREVLWYSHGLPLALGEYSPHAPRTRPDLVICREMLEHLTVLQLVQAVRQLVKLSTQFVYLTTRLAKTPEHLLSVETEFDADPTHITCLTKPFLRTLFVLEGCRSRPDLEAQMDWQGKGRCLVFEVPQ